MVLLLLHKSSNGSEVCFANDTKRSVSSNLGMRHRAAAGISENTDCIAVVVSEERKNICGSGRTT